MRKLVVLFPRDVLLLVIVMYTLFWAASMRLQTEEDRSVLVGKEKKKSVGRKLIFPGNAVVNGTVGFHIMGCKNTDLVKFQHG